MNGKAGGIPAALAGAENVPDQSDCPNPDSVSQEIRLDQSNSCERQSGALLSVAGIGGLTAVAHA